MCVTPVLWNPTVLHPLQGGLLVRADSDLDEASEVEEERERPVLGSESESSTYGLSKKKKKKPKEKKEKKPRKKKRDEDDEDEDEDDGNMKVRRSSEIQRFQKKKKPVSSLTSRCDVIKMINYPLSAF